MNQIHQNPFRILGLPVTATDREITKRIGDMSIYSDMGKPIKYEIDSYFPIKPVRTAESINDATQKIDRLTNKIFYSMFWFWETTNNVIDEMAFEELKNGNITKSIQLWMKGIDKGITSKNNSNYKNLSVLLMVSSESNTENIFKSIALTGEFVSNGFLDKYINLLSRGTHSIDPSEIINLYIDEIITEVKSNLDLDSGHLLLDFIKSFQSFPEAIQNSILDKVVGNHAHNINSAIEVFSNKVSNNKCNSGQYGIELFKNIEKDANTINFLVSNDIPHYQPIIDKLVDNLIDACIFTWNENDVHINDDLHKQISEIEELIKNFAVSTMVSDRFLEQVGRISLTIIRREKLKPLNPLQVKFNKAIEQCEMLNKSEHYQIAKQFVFNIKMELDQLKKLLVDIEDEAENDIIIDAIVHCALFVQNCSITIANDLADWGKAVELVDMTRRILIMDYNGEQVVIDLKLLHSIMIGRKTLTNNISNQEGGYTSLLFGGGIRMAKKRLKCGCGSGKYLKDCCSV